MGNFAEQVAKELYLPISYWDVTYEMSLPVRGIAGAQSVLLNGWDPIALAPGLVHVDSAGNLSILGIPTGRSQRQILLDSFAIVAAAETLITMSYSVNNAAPTTGTSYNVTANKRFRLQAILASIHTEAGNTTAVEVILRLRVNNAGDGIISSPIQLVVSLPGVAAENSSSGPIPIAIPDGWEFIGGAGIAVTLACAGFVATTAAPKVDLTLIGYEY